ncbi:hypothetical protein PV325_000298, partial [Microctonus aethiopoides]
MRGSAWRNKTLVPSSAAALVSPLQLQNHQLWWSGPAWLLKDESHCPTQQSFIDSSCEIEAGPITTFLAATTKLEYRWNLIEHTNSLHKLFRLTAICFRILAQLKLLPDSSSVIYVPLADMTKAKYFW